MFKNPFSFDGRIRRLEYGLTFIIYLVFYVILLAVTSASEGGAGAIIILVLIIPMVWFLWAQGAKRCHDLDKSGWWQIIPFYPLVLIFQDGQAGSNQYGRNPKGVGGAGDEYLDTETLDGHLRS